MAYVSSNRAASASLAQRFADFRDNALQNYRDWRVFRNTLNELNSLSAREMSDLGLNPTMIRRIALEAAYGKNA